MHVRHAPQFTLTLAKAIENARIPVNYEVLEFEGEKVGEYPVLGESEHGQPTGLEHFPIFDENYRKILVGKILDRYWNMEIGHESADLFWHALRRWMNENMPVYNELYRSIPFDQAMRTIDIVTTSNDTTTGASTSDTTTTGTSDTTNSTTSDAKAFNNEMPQTAMDEDESYATSATETHSEAGATGHGEEAGTANTTGTQNATATGESTTRGYQANASDLLAAWRANILNVDVMILDGMRNLFSLVWRNSETAITTEYMRGLL